MNADLPKNEEVIFTQQNIKVVQGHDNKARRVVSAAWLVFWLLLAAAALDLWLLRLCGVIELPL